MIEIEVTGISETIARLQKLSFSVERRLVEGAGRAALKPVVAAVRARVPVDTGTLRKSIGTKKAKRTPKGTIVLSVGARHGFSFVDKNGHKQDPFYYAIPIEYGHVVKNHAGDVIGHIAPVGMFRATYEQHRASVIETFASELDQRITAEMSK